LRAAARRSSRATTPASSPLAAADRDGAAAGQCGRRGEGHVVRHMYD
jgi:hypothetical protein